MESNDGKAQGMNYNNREEVKAYVEKMLGGDSKHLSNWIASELYYAYQQGNSKGWSGCLNEVNKTFKKLEAV